MSKFAARERQAEERNARKITNDPDFRFAQNLSQGVGSDVQAGLAGALQGDLSGLDLVQLGLKSQTLRALGDFLTNINTRDVENPPSRGQSIKQDIQDLKETGQALLEVKDHMLKFVDEVTSLRLPEIGLDPLEMAVKGVPGVTLSEVEKQLGRCT